MLSNAEVMKLIDRLLREQPRNLLVTTICQELRDRVLDRRHVMPPKLLKFDRRIYQREYMRAWRAKRRGAL